MENVLRVTNAHVTRTAADAAATDEPVSKSALWTSRVIGGVVTAFLAFDGAIKVANVPAVAEACEQLGIPVGVMPGVGVLLIAMTALYAIRRTAVLGAVLLTGYLGGAVAIHVRVEGPAFSIVFPVIVGVLAWTALFLRDRRLGAFLPWRAQTR